MSKVMAVTFEEYGRLHYLDPGEEDYTVGDWVLYPTEEGPEVARVVWAPQLGQVDSPLPRCAGRAEAADLRRDEARRLRRAEIHRVAVERITAHALPMKVVATDFVDTSREFGELAVVYFTAPGRVDFRALVGDLARALSARIDLRQVASRDAARLTGGVGMCGRELCCTLFLDEVEPVSMRLARSQNLAGNPLQIQGACGKLLCCLAYEHPLYVDFLKRAPAVGERVAGGTVVAHHVPTDEVSVRGPAGVRRCPLTSLCSRLDTGRPGVALGKEC